MTARNLKIARETAKAATKESPLKRLMALEGLRTASANKLQETRSAIAQLTKREVKEAEEHQAIVREYEELFADIELRAKA